MDNKIDTIKYDDLSVIAERVADRTNEKFGTNFLPSNILEIVRIGVFEYGFKCLINNSKFVLRRMGTFKIKDFKKNEVDVKQFFKDKRGMKEKMKEKSNESKKSSVVVIDNQNKDSIFVSLNAINEDTKIINNNGNWNGNFGKSEFRPDVEELE